MSKRRTRVDKVIDLAAVRSRRKLEEALASNQTAISGLFTSGALFSRQGARAGRDLLLAHQNLLKVVALLTRLSEPGGAPAPRPRAQVDKVYAELDALLVRTSRLTRRSGTYLAQLRGE